MWNLEKRYQETHSIHVLINTQANNSLRKHYDLQFSKAQACSLTDLHFLPFERGGEFCLTSFIRENRLPPFHTSDAHGQLGLSRDLKKKSFKSVESDWGENIFRKYIRTLKAYATLQNILVEHKNNFAPTRIVGRGIRPFTPINASGDYFLIFSSSRTELYIKPYRTPTYSSIPLR